MPERENLVGWQGAETQVAARHNAHFVCPGCEQAWTEDDRARANAEAKLVHGDQSLDAEGQIAGDTPATDTFGFRWSAVHNLFLSAGDFAADEWRASRAVDQECAEREMRQFVWCLPVEASKWSQTPLEVLELVSRLSSWPRGILPPDTKWLTAAVDIGKYLLHCVVVAGRHGVTGASGDYGRIEVASSDLGVETAVMVALRQFREMVQVGWPLASEKKVPDQIWIDAGYMTDVVYSFARESGSNLFRPCVGQGATQHRRQTYNRPTHQGPTIHHIGQSFHLSLLEAERLYLVEVDADYWKTWLHQRLASPMTNTGALTFYQSLPQEHLALGREPSQSWVGDAVEGQRQLRNLFSPDGCC